MMLRSERREAPTRFVTAAFLAVLCSAGCARALPEALPNDHRAAVLDHRGDTLVFAIEARLAAWTPDSDVDTAMTVQAFAAADGVPRIPGPLLRASVGTTVEIRIRNSIADSALVVHGLRPGHPDDDTLRVESGSVRTVRFMPAVPGTFLYWGTTTGDRSEITEGRDGQLRGVIVVDPAGARPDTSERIFVITTLDVLPDSSRPEPRDDLFDLAVNGRSWPHTERLRYATGDTVRWRWVNATATLHPMHLHGFHFTVLAKGTGRSDTTYPDGEQRQAVTESMGPGSTFQMRWVPTGPGNWLFHCHMIPHVSPFPVRPDSVRAHDAHDATDHISRAMSGLVLGIEVRTRGGESAPVVGAIAHTLRLFAQQSSALAVEDTAFARGYALQRGPMPPRSDSIVVPGLPLVLTRGVRTAIVVHNRLPEPTSVHWHGMELESYYDGVAGWSGADARRAPMLAPGDSFVAVMTPPRAGTFMYHPHMDEEDQLTAGMFGPLLVLEPGERFDPATDLLFTMGVALADGQRGATVNGARSFAPLPLRAGVTYRFRFLNINAAASVTVALQTDSTPLLWQPRAKDGADLPAALRLIRPSRLRIAVGETYDFLWRPMRPMRAELVFNVDQTPAPMRVPIVVR